MNPYKHFTPKLIFRTLVVILIIFIGMLGLAIVITKSNTNY